MEKFNKLERYELDLIERAIDMSRDMQGIACARIQQMFKDTPKGVDKKTFNKHLENNVKEWDRQMTYYYVLGNIADKFSKLKGFKEVELKPK